MSDYIKREDAIEKCMTIQGAGYKWLKDIPSEDVAPVRHGHWIGTEYDGYADGFPVYSEYACSVCGNHYDTDDGEITYKYCPNCGAKMDGEREDDDTN